MSISIEKYVEIKSGINNLKTVTNKELIARIFCTNSKLPVGSSLEFESLKNVGKFFSVTSDEYKLAQKYFNFVSKYQTQAKKISFAKDYRNGSNAFILATEQADINELQQVVAGTIEISINGTTKTIENINLSSCSTLELVAQQLNTEFTRENINVVCSLTVENTFKFTLDGTPADNDTLSVSTTDLTNLLKLTENYNAILSVGAQSGKSIETVLEKNYETDNNFATFAFLSTLSNEDITNIANWNRDNHPTEFLFVAKVLESNFVEIYNNVKEIDGITLELCDDTEEGKFNFIIPMAITATTDYNRRNGTQNYMYNQISNVKVLVDSDDEAKKYDGKRINYYGRTQQAGQKIAFYQDGVCQGRYEHQNIFINEIWLKDAMTTKFLNYMLLTSNWSYSLSGIGIGDGLANEIIEKAKENGVITIGKEIEDNDKIYIRNLTNDDNAWRNIQDKGYYFKGYIQKEKKDTKTIYKYCYLLVYSKGDMISKVEGSNIAI